ncbi:MAG: hypothetical protein EOO70_00475 [Myxococcaceae bacterium]|nr:MAG: hypothetical protein EOO70_00475 [Myxococcaceae bacterium]
MVIGYVKGSLFSAHRRQGEPSAYLSPNRGPLAKMLYAWGYFETASTLGRQMLRNHAPVDTAIYPLVYLYRHGVELALKQLAHDLAVIACEQVVSAKKMGQHNLLALWGPVQSWLETAEYTLAEDAPRMELHEAAAVIEDLDAVDPDGQAARYDARKDGTHTLNTFETLNIQTLVDGMEGLSEFLHFWTQRMLDERLHLEQQRRERQGSCP